MSSLTDPLARRVAALEAERLAPLPRASHVLAVDVDDIAVLLDHVRATRRGQPVSDDVASACHRLSAAVTGHATARPVR